MIAFGSAEYEQECLLRNEVLRKPLGLSLWDEELSRESGEMHFGLFSDENALDACGVAVALNEKRAKIRQVAVQDEKQGEGLGRKLLQEAEVVLREKGFEEVVLHSRVTVVGFYLRLGYEKEGDVFEEIGLAHQKMKKRL